MREAFEALFWWLSQRDAVVWWIAIVLMGLCAFPLAFGFFRWLPDRGYAFAKVFALVLLTYTLWVGGLLHILPFGRATVIALLALMTAASAAVVLRRRSEFRAFVRERWTYMLAVEALFTISFAVAVYLRSFVPEISIPEKTADFAFINGILRSDYSPPQDPWWSGGSISWYYFGHMNVAVLTKLTAIPSRVTFNLAIALVVALAASGVFGIVYNLLATRLKWRAMLYGLAGVVFLLFLSNIIGVVELLSANGVGSKGFYSVLDINGITQAVESPKWYPTEWWWIVRSVQIASPWDGREFPFFTFLQGDLHAHMMVIPFDFLTLAAIVDLWRSDHLPIERMGGQGSDGLLSEAAAGVRRAALEGYRFWRRYLPRLAGTALVVGATGFVELWAMPAFILLLVAVPVLKKYVHDGRFSLGAVEAGLAFGVPPAILAVLAFSPFYVGLNSVSEGIQPIEVVHRGFAPLEATVTQPHHFLYQWVTHMWLLLSFLVVAVVVVARRSTARRLASRRGARSLAASAASVVWLALVPIGFWALLVLVKRGPLGLADEIETRGSSLITLLILSALLSLVVLAFRLQAKRAHEGEGQGVLLVITITGTALLMILGTELFWVQDPFGTRFNTVFRIGFQAWILLSVALAYALYYIFSRWPVGGRSLLASKAVWGVITAVIILGALVYPLPATLWRTGEFNATQTLDGLSFVRAYNSDGYAAFIWLRENVPEDAVVLEAVGADYDPGRGQVSAVTGLQTILGWPWHECRWRAYGTCTDPLSERPLAERSEAIEKIYTAPDLSEAMPLLKQYGVDYVYVGPAERQAYGEDGLAKFESSFEAVYTSSGVTIYRVDDSVAGQPSAPVPEATSR
jgi:YYY domain-containing protein